MNRGSTHQMTGKAGGRDLVRRRRLRTTADCNILFLLAFLIQTSIANGEATVSLTVPFGPADPMSHALRDESVALETDADAVARRAAISYFSQTTDPLAGDRSRFRLSQATPADAGAVTEAAAPILPEQAMTARFGGEFAATRDFLVGAIVTATDAERSARALDYAQFLIAQMMLPEARSVTETVLADGPTLLAADHTRALGYQAIVTRLSDGTVSALPQGWSDDPLWPVLAAGQPLSGPPLRAAMSALADHSRAVANAALPLLFDAALVGGDTVAAAEILAAAPAGTDLDGTPLLDLMRGRLSLAQGAEDMAFETFARLSEGNDRPAAEARIALADMALARKDAALLPQVHQLLQDGLARWRGDATALRLRVRLARVAEDVGDVTTAIEVMSAIHHEHPRTPEAGLAGERIGVMVGHLTSAIADGDMSLQDAVEAVRRLDAAMAGRGAWVAARAALARRLEDAGLREAARAEYAAIALMPFDTLQSADPAVADRVTVRHAALLLDAGRDGAALAVLGRHTYPRDPEQMDRYIALRLAAGRTAILPPMLLSARKVAGADGVDDPAVQLSLARVAATTGQPDAALAAFDRGLTAADAPQRLTASRIAAEAGDKARADRFAGTLGGDRAALQQAVIQSLAAPRLSGQRLSVSGASALIGAARTAGESVDALLAPKAAP